MTRAGLRAIGFELLADDSVASRTVTAVRLPEGVDWKAFNGDLRAHGLMVAGGQGKLKGKIFRVGHLGGVTTDDMLATVGVLEEVAIRHGIAVEPGVGVAAAQRALLATRAPEAVPA
jgi:aspartate aminotransferase-like enzyme